MPLQAQILFTDKGEVFFGETVSRYSCITHTPDSRRKLLVSPNYRVQATITINILGLAYPEDIAPN